MDIEKR